MSKVEPNGEKTRGTLTVAEDNQRQLDLTAKLLAERELAAEATAAEHRRASGK